MVAVKLVYECEFVGELLWSCTSFYVITFMLRLYGLRLELLTRRDHTVFVSSWTFFCALERVATCMYSAATEAELYPRWECIFRRYSCNTRWKLWILNFNTYRVKFAESRDKVFPLIYNLAIISLPFLKVT